MKDFITEVDHIQQETPDVKTVRLKFQPNDEFYFKVGQYVMVYEPDQQESTPYSISNTPSEFQRTRCIELCIKHVEGGSTSTYMHNLKVGDRVKLSGPMGRFIFAEPPRNDIVFLATGTGISPLRSMIRKAFEIKTKKQIYLFFGARTEKEIIWRSEFENLERDNLNFHYTPTLSREQWLGKTGYVQNVMKEMFSRYSEKDYYIAGVKPMVEEIVKLLQDLGVKQENIHTEKFI